MSTETPSSRNWFDAGGGAYAQFRPDYPPALAAFLATAAPAARLAVDVGCGNGQLTRLLAPHFARVVGVDPSADQIAHATAHERIDYLCAPAERLPLEDGGADLVCAAQAAHWFDLPRFYDEVRRIAAPDALLALVSYGVMRLEPELDARFQAFYRDEVGPYWPPERQMVDTGYAGIDFPFAEFAGPALDIRVEGDLAAFLGYVATWSAVRHARSAGQDAMLDAFARDIAVAWGDAHARRPVAWPIAMRIGRV